MLTGETWGSPESISSSGEEGAGQEVSLTREWSLDLELMVGGEFFSGQRIVMWSNTCLALQAVPASRVGLRLMFAVLLMAMSYSSLKGFDNHP